MPADGQVSRAVPALVRAVIRDMPGTGGQPPGNDQALYHCAGSREGIWGELEGPARTRRCCAAPSVNAGKGTAMNRGWLIALGKNASERPAPGAAPGLTV